MAKWLIVCIVRLIIFKKEKGFILVIQIQNTFHVESFIKFNNMQSIFINAFLTENGSKVNSFNS